MDRSRLAVAALHRGAQVGALVVMAVLALAGPVAAREPVDPGTLNPPPPDFFNAVCFEIGRGTVCDLAFSVSIDTYVDEPSGIVCNGTELLFSQTRSVVGKRFYDRNGDLTQRHFRESLAGTFKNPSTGRTAAWIQHDTVIHDLGVPGDLSTGTIKITGLSTRVFLPGGGTVIVDSGTVLRDRWTDTILHESGNHPFDAYFSGRDLSALAPLCDALD